MGLAKFSVGNKIKVREDLMAGKTENLTVLPEMAAYAGRIATVTKWLDINRGYFQIDLDNGSYHWNADMFDNISPVEEIKIEKQNAIKAYNNGCSSVKKTLEDLFGIEIFKEDELTLDRCNEIMLEKVPDHGINRIIRYPTYMKQQINLLADLIAVAYVLNEGWEPDWNDKEELKYYILYDCNVGYNTDNVDAENTKDYLDSGWGIFFKSRDLTKKAIELVGGINRFREVFKVKIDG